MKQLLAAVLIFAGTLVAAENAPKGKYAIILLSGAETNEARSRAVHALLYAADLAEHGHDVVLIFDGAGAGWVRELDKPEHPFHKHYLKIKQLGMTQEICDYCTDAHDLQQDMIDEQLRLLNGDYEGHPSIAKWVGRGYQVIVL
jgi:hypothetical protein